MNSSSSSSSQSTQGNTSLHYFMQTVTNANDFALFVNHLGSGVASQMARTINDQGDLPYDILRNHNHLAEKDYQAIVALIFLLFQFNDCLNLGVFISPEKTLSQYNITANTQLYNNIQLACYVANKVKTVIDSSTTHPQTNFYTHEKRIELWNQNEEDKKLIPEQIFAVSKHQMLLNDIEQPLRTRRANCGGLSNIALKYLHSIDPSLQAAIIEIEKGDHVFVVIGLEGDPENFMTWGANAVVCDIWAGKVYPATHIPTQLTTYECIWTEDTTDFVNVITSFNPNYHSLKHLFSFDPIVSPINEQSSAEALVRRNLFTPSSTSNPPQSSTSSAVHISQALINNVNRS